MPLTDDLLEQAQTLVDADERRPKQANIRRAVSSAYYALFHEVLDATAREFVGGAAAKSEIGHRLRRATSHANIKKACAWFSRAWANVPKPVKEMLGDATDVSADLRQFCEFFIELQGERHRADYDLALPMTRHEAKRLVAAARSAIKNLRAIEPSKERTTFLLGCLLGESLVKNA